MPRHYSVNPYCVACRLRQAVCICDRMPRLALATRVVVVMHSIEWGRSSNTGHLTRMFLINADLRVHGSPRRSLDSSGLDPQSAETLVLFPGRGAEVLTHDFAAGLRRPLTLLVPDGNWNQAKNMMRRVPTLARARSVQMETTSLAVGGLRRNVETHHRSTFEAIAQAIGILEGSDAEDRLLEFFREYLDRKSKKFLKPA